LPLHRQLRTGTDLSLFANRDSRSLKFTEFARYNFLARIGQGTKIPSIIEVFSLADDQAIAAMPWPAACGSPPA